MLILGLVNCLPENEGARQHLIGLRRETVNRIRHRLEQGIREGDLPKDMDVSGLATFYATVMQGLSLQARDGASRADLLSVISAAMMPLTVAISSSER